MENEKDGTDTELLITLGKLYCLHVLVLIVRNYCMSLMELDTDWFWCFPFIYWLLFVSAKISF